MPRVDVRLALVLLLALVIGGCGRQQTELEDGASAEAAYDRVLAEVDGEPVLESELAVHVTQLFGERGLYGLTPEIRRKALESLVMARMLARVAEAELDAEELREIEVRAALQREQLLVNAYLRREAAPEPVTAAMVREYYERNPERFGAGKLRSFELIVATEAQREPARGELLATLANAGAHAEWATFAQSLRGQGMEVEYRRGTVADDLLDARLRAVAANLSVGQTSAPGLLDRRPFVLRVVDEREQPPQPLEQVSAEIRQSLAARQLQAAVQAVTAPLLERVEVRYFLDEEE